MDAMNKERRKRLAKVEEAISQMEDLKEFALDELSDVLAEEEEAYENLPDSIKESERGEEMQMGIETMTEAVQGLEDFEPVDLSELL
jgi:hypothetical protein